MTTRIYHNPKCSTSRKVLAAINDAGEEPEIILYLETPPSRAELTKLLSQMQIGARQLLRKKESLYKELSLDDPKVSDAKALDAMIKHPILIERPIVVTEKGARLCRPPETLNEIL